MPVYTLDNERQARPKRRAFRSNLSLSSRDLSLADIRRLAQAEPKEFVARAQKRIDDGEWRWGHVNDLRDFWRAFSDVEVPAEIMIHGQKRTILSSAFPLLSGGLSVAEVNAAYDSVATVGEQLTETMESKKSVMTIGEVIPEAAGGFKHKEGQDYKLVGAGEERYDIGSNAQGLRAQLTQEAIDKNELENFVEYLNFIGRIAAEEQERLTLLRVTDNAGSAGTPAEPYALRKGKTGTQLYTATANSPGARAPSGTRVNDNPLVDHNSLNTARIRMSTFLNELGKRLAIPMSQCVLLVPDALSSTASMILNSVLVPGEVNSKNPWGPEGQWRPMFLPTARLDDISTTVWYLGDFKRQFVRKVALDTEIVTSSMDLLTYLRSRVAFEIRAGWDVEVGARAYNRVVQNLPAQTAPTNISE